MTRSLAIAISVVLLLLTASRVEARVSPAEARKARRLYKKGQNYYKRGVFLRAAEIFKKGYTIDPRPAFLINAAQAYRQAKKPKLALEQYRKFLDVAPTSRLRPQVEGIVQELAGEVGETSPAETSPGGTSPGDKPAPPFVQPDPPETPKPKVAASSPFYKKWWFWTAVGVVVVGTATGVGVAAANSGGDDYVKEGGLGVVRW
ncbi:MAG: tetratricopeptide repeat protein [Deltaproteobacteria bacterium]|nr:tetratricopeptide repeat protein [Deltaproteobacteria bacterium]